MKKDRRCLVTVAETRLARKCEGNRKKGGGFARVFASLGGQRSHRLLKERRNKFT